jgi:hypothetical protein
MFIRWAIEHSCPLRELFPQRLPDTTFRQLRGVREVGYALSENRIQQGICLHPNAKTSAPELALGFPMEEVLRVFGDVDSISQNCSSCPANALLVEDSRLLAGCFGMLAADLRFKLNEIIRGEFRQSEIADLVTGCGDLTEEAELRPHDAVTLFEHVVAVNDLQRECQLWGWNSKPLWIAMWQAQPRSERQWRLVETILSRALDHLGHRRVSAQQEMTGNEGSTMAGDLEHLLEAVRRCLKHALPLHIELVPAGYSDGMTWTIYPHCGNCKATWLDRAKECQSCKGDGRYQNALKLKVLGIRPYLIISEILGLNETKRLLES